MNSFGRKFRVTIFGESHGENLGIVIDGVYPGMELSEADFTEDIGRRKSGAKGTTPRREEDIPHIVSGIYDGCTTGAPLTILFGNNNTRSEDYSRFEDTPRPGHADYVASIKTGGFNDPRGGGHFSGRITLALVAAGVVAKKMLRDMSISALVDTIGGEADSERWNALIDNAMRDGDSLGGTVRCEVEKVPVGLGEPFFDSVESLLSHAVFSIPGVRGIEFGDGFASSAMRGSEHNDPIVSSEGKTARNGSGGVNGGIANGNNIVFRVAFKPTSTISQPQKTYNFTEDKMDVLKGAGRHDVCFALRTPVIVEAVTAIVLADLLTIL